jgi:hypothetical protein
MSLSKTYIKGSPILLDAFMEWAGIHPLAFHDIDITTCIPNLALSYVQCQHFNQFNWQGSGISIELLTEKLNEAYNLVEQIIDFSLQPTFIEENLGIPKFFRSYLTPNGYLTYDTILQTNKHCIKSFGQRKLERLDTEALLTYSDLDLDGFAEHVSIVFTLDTDIDFSTLDLAMVYITHESQSGNVQYKIPVKLESYTEATVTFSGYSWNFIQPSIVLNTSFTKSRSIDGCNSDFYVDNVELWYESTDQTKPHGYIVAHDSSDSIPFQVHVINNDTGRFKLVPGSVDQNGAFSENSRFLTTCSNPSFIKVYYVSHCGNNTINTIGLNVCPTLLNSVFKLTCCLLPIELCSECSNLKTVVEYYQTDLAYKFSGRGESSGFNYSFESFNEAWNRSCRGAVEAFRELKEFQSSKCNTVLHVIN